LPGWVAESAKAFQRAVQSAPRVQRGGEREPMQYFLEAVDRVASIEHQTDEKERDVMSALIATAIDCRQLYVVEAIVRHLEEAADSLMRAGLMLRDHILAEVTFE
jgi:uncharacterized protein Yka (UPF0111/DUF47 family)